MTGFVCALVLPWFLGISWLSLLWRSANRAMLFGYGYIIGIGMVMVLLRLWYALGLPFSFWLISGFILFLATMPLLIRRVFIRADVVTGAGAIDSPLFSYETPASRMRVWVQNTLFVLFAALLIMRFSTIFLDTAIRPLFAWDAWMNFAPKARVWFELLELRSFISPEDWLRADNPEAYTLGNPQAWSYPITVPLIMFWHALGLDTWRDDLIKIPWLICGIALALALYGQLRQFELPRHQAMICVYLLMSMPYIGIHMLLGGYADLWLATTVCLSFLSFLRWRESRQWQDLLLILVLVLLGTSIKHPGFLWGALLLLTLVIDRLGKWGFLAFIGFCTAAGVAVFVIGIDWHLPQIGRIALSAQEIIIPYRGAYDIEFRDISQALIQSFFLQPNWHVFWYAVVLLLPLGMLTGRMRFHHLGPLLFVLMSMSTLLLIFYFIPRYSKEALNMVTFNRSLLHITPIFFVFFVWWYLVPVRPARATI